MVTSINLIVTLYRWFFGNGIHFLSYCVFYLCMVNSLGIVYVSSSDDDSFSLQSIVGISSCDYFEVLLVLFQLYVTSSQRVLYSDNSRVVVCCGSSSCIDFVFDMLYYLASVFFWICSILIYQYFFDKSIRIWWSCNCAVVVTQLLSIESIRISIVYNV